MKTRSIVLLLGMALAVFAIVAYGQEPATSNVSVLPANTGSIGPGKVVKVESSDLSYTPTAAQMAAHEQLLAAKSTHLAPPLGPHTTEADVEPSSGPGGGPSTDDFVQPAPNTFTVFKKSLINSICPNCAQSTVNEPSVANSGKTVVETSNWNIAYTLNGGASTITWSNQNPYSLSPG